MEMEKVPKEGYPIIGLWISGLQRTLSLKNVLFPLKLVISLLKAYFIIKRFSPDVVMGFGGYASGPLVKVASKKGIASAIQEQNAYAGITNQWLSSTVDKVCVAHAKMDTYFPVKKIVLTGNPVRNDIAHSAISREEASRHFGLRADKPTILVIGGSLGAKTINESIMSNIIKLSNEDIQLIWQTGKKYYKEINDDIKGVYQTVRYSAFIYEMDYAYKTADVVISRAGALSISELAVAGKASVLVPSPNVAEDHQTKNAQALVNHKAALMVKDSMAMEQLVPLAIDLLRDKEKKDTLSKNILSLAKPNAAKEIVDIIEQLVLRK